MAAGAVDSKPCLPVQQCTMEQCAIAWCGQVVKCAQLKDGKISSFFELKEMYG